MMKTLVFIGFMLFGITMVFGAQSRGYFSHPDHPGKCYVSETEIYEPGDYESKDECLQKSCSPNGYMTWTSCGKKASPPGECEYVGPSDVSAPYPDCCVEKYNCKFGDKIKEVIW